MQPGSLLHGGRTEMEVSYCPKPSGSAIVTCAKVFYSLLVGDQHEASAAEGLPTFHLLSFIPRRRWNFLLRVMDRDDSVNCFALLKK